MENEIEVKLIGMILDPVSKSPVMILKPINDPKIIPIWIGGNEANAITMELENITSPRPMTHDLLKSILTHLKISIEKVVINDIINNTYYAELHLKSCDQMSVIDCRPSDAVAMAIKNKSRIYISESVYKTSIFPDFFSNIIENEEKLEKWFDNLLPEDFGNIEQ